MEEWHDYNRELRRSRVIFKVTQQAFAFRDNDVIKSIAMIDDLTGILILKARHRREFFRSILPDAKFFFRRQNNPPDYAPVPDWLEPLRQHLLDKPAK